MSRRASPLLTGLALLALAWAQVFGLMRGYLCDCGDHVSITALDHCHGPHGDACHDHDAVELPHDHTEHSEDESTHEHTPVKESVQAQSVALQTALGLEAPALTVVALLEDFWTEPLQRLAEPAPRPPPRDDALKRASWPEVLTHRIALRI